MNSFSLVVMDARLTRSRLPDLLAGSQHYLPVRRVLQKPLYSTLSPPTPRYESSMCGQAS